MFSGNKIISTMISFPVVFLINIVMSIYLKYCVVHGGSMSLKVTVLFKTTFEMKLKKLLYQIRTRS